MEKLPLFCRLVMVSVCLCMTTIPLVHYRRPVDMEYVKKRRMVVPVYQADPMDSDALEASTKRGMPMEVDRWM